MTAYPYEPAEVRITLYGDRSLCEGEVRAAVVDALMKEPDFVPELMGFERVKGEPFDRAHLCDGTEWSPSAQYYQLRRDRKQTYRLRMSLDKASVLRVGFPPGKTPPARLPSVFSLADRLVEAFRPVVGWVHIDGRTQGHHTDPVLRVQRLMDMSAEDHLPSYRRQGAGGLGLRTYLGPAYTEHLAPLLDALPAPATVTPLACPDTVRVDLAEDPWTATAPELHASWQAAMEHLAPSGCFSVPSFDSSGRFARTRAHPHP